MSEESKTKEESETQEECTDYPALSNDRNVNKWFKPEATNHTFSGKHSGDESAYKFRAWVVKNDKQFNKGFLLPNGLSQERKYISIDDPALQNDLKKIGICYEDIIDIYWGKSTKDSFKERSFDLPSFNSQSLYAVVVLINADKYDTVNVGTRVNEKLEPIIDGKFISYKYGQSHKIPKNRYGGTRKKNKRSRKTRRRSRR
jgi:hypothetical protein